MEKGFKNDKGMTVYKMLICEHWFYYICYPFVLIENFIPKLAIHDNYTLEANITNNLDPVTQIRQAI